jgi:A32 protein
MANNSNNVVYQPQSEEQKNKSKKRKRHPYEIEHLEIPDPEYMGEVPERLRNKDLPGFPSTILAIGGPGSGKTNVLMNFLTKKEFWLHFFDKIYLLGPTVKSDKLFKKIIVPDDQIVHEANEFIPKLGEWTKAQIERVQSDSKSAPKCLFVFEDITSYYHTAQAAPEFAKCFNAIRHHKASAYANVHKLKAFNRTARMSCMHIMVWPVTVTEQKQLYEDYGPSELTVQDFLHVCKAAWRPDENNAKPFLYINKYAKEEERYRKCFTHIIDIKQFEGVARRKSKIKNLEDRQFLKNMELNLPQGVQDEDVTKAPTDKKAKIDPEAPQKSGHNQEVESDAGDWRKKHEELVKGIMEDYRIREVLARRGQAKGPFAYLK